MVSSLVDMLSGDERVRAARFRTTELRVRFVVAHGALRTILSGYLGIPPGAVRFDTSPIGQALRAGRRLDLQPVTLRGARPLCRHGRWPGRRRHRAAATGGRRGRNRASVLRSRRDASVPSGEKPGADGRIFQYVDAQRGVRQGGRQRPATRAQLLRSGSVAATRCVRGSGSSPRISRRGGACARFPRARNTSPRSRWIATSRRSSSSTGRQTPWRRFRRIRSPCTRDLRASMSEAQPRWSTGSAVLCADARLAIHSVVQLTTIDLNSDLGESFGRWTLGSDAELMKVITSANVACGYHAGDPGVMRATVRLARDAGVAVGAHPGLPDLAGFGRRNMAVSAEEVEDMVLYQVGALAAIAACEGVRLQHVKPHGALYNMAVKDRGLADAIARAVRAFDAGARAVRASRQRARAGWLRRGAPRRPRGIRRSRLRSRRLADAADPSGRCHPLACRRHRPCRADGQGRHRPGNERQRHPDARRYHLHARRHAASHELTRQLRAALEADGIVVAPPRRDRPHAEEWIGEAVLASCARRSRSGVDRHRPRLPDVQRGLSSAVTELAKKIDQRRCVTRALERRDYFGAAETGYRAKNRAWTRPNAPAAIAARMSRAEPEKNVEVVERRAADSDQQLAGHEQVAQVGAREARGTRSSRIGVERRADRACSARS